MWSNWSIIKTEQRKENGRLTRWALVRCKLCKEESWRRKHSLSRAHRCKLRLRPPGESISGSSWVVTGVVKTTQQKYLVRCSDCGTEREILPADFESGVTCKCHRYEKISETMKARYGAQNPWAVPTVREKIDYTQVTETRLKTMLSEYGVENISQTAERRKELSDSKTVHTIDGLGLKQWANQARVSYSATRAVLTKYGLEFTKRWAEYVNSGASSLEVFFHKIVPQAERYGKFLPGTRIKPDFKLTDSVFIECDGLYYHSETNYQDKRHHFNRRVQAFQAGYRLIFFRQDEILFQPEIVASMCAVLAGNVARKIPGRKCHVREVPRSHADAFLQQNHLMGRDHASSALGLYHGDELVSLVTYRKKGPGVLDISRFCTNLNLVVLGGYTKLMKQVEALHPGFDIESWVDLRYADGHSLVKNGYRLVRIVPSFRWTDFVVTYPRQYCRADDGKSEREIANEKSLCKIWDCGQALYRKEFKS